MFARIFDLIFSIGLVLLTPFVAAFGLKGIKQGDMITMISSIGIIVASIFLFGLACMGFKRLTIYFHHKAIDDGSERSSHSA